MRDFIKDRVNPALLRRLKVGIAPHTRWLAGQRAFLLSELGISTVLDVGANVGQYGRRLRRGGFTGSIHSFEPGADAFAHLQRAARADAAWHVHHYALGDETGTATFRVWPDAGSEAATLRTPSNGMVSMLGQPVCETVQVRTLAQWLDHSAIDPARTWLKVDVQGFEREVLRGAGNQLAAFPAVEVEAALGEIYLGGAALPELLQILDVAGFVPASVVTERFHTGWRGAADVDLIAIRRDLSRLPV